MHFELDEQALLLRDSLRKFLKTEVLPLEQEHAENGKDNAQIAAGLRAPLRRGITALDDEIEPPGVHGPISRAGSGLSSARG